MRPWSGKCFHRLPDPIPLSRLPLGCAVQACGHGMVPIDCGGGGGGDGSAELLVERLRLVLELLVMLANVRSDLNVNLMISAAVFQSACLLMCVPSQSP